MALIADFSGDELVLKWTRNPTNDTNNVNFDRYECDFVVNDVVQRTVRTREEDEPQAVYRFNEMVKDQGTTSPNRTISVRVREVDAFNNKSANALGTFTNDRPPVPAFTAKSFFGEVLITITPVVDEDLAGYMVFRGTSAGFTPSTGNRIYIGTATQYRDTTVVDGTTYYYKVCAYDKFGSAVANWNISSALSAASQMPKEVPTWVFKDVVFTPNSPSTNRISWSSGTAIRSWDGTTLTKTVPAGNLTANTTERFIYFDWDAAVMKANTSILNVYTSANNQLLATYKGGTDLKEGVNEPIIDGRRILTGTVGASQLVSAELITQTAQIANGLIDTIHVAGGAIKNTNIFDGTITGSKLANVTITNSKIENGTITGTKLANVTITGSKIAGGTIEGSHLANVTITASKIANGTITGSKIDDATIEASHIKGGTITGALIANSTITGGKIGNYSVDALNISLSAIGRTYMATSTTVRVLSRDVEYEATKVTIPTGIEGRILITGVWSWDNDDNTSCRYRILKNGTQLASYTGKNSGTRDTTFTMAAATSVEAGDVISLRITRVTSGNAEMKFAQLTALLTRR